MQKDLRLVRAAAAAGAAAAACAAQSRLQRPQRQGEMQDQDEEVQDEKAIDQVREEMQEGQKEEETVPEDLLRARLPRLNRPLTSAPSSRSRVRGRGRVYGNCPLPQPAICARRSSTRVREAVRSHSIHRQGDMARALFFGAALGRFKGQGSWYGNCLGGKAGCGDEPPKAGKVVRPVGDGPPKSAPRKYAAWPRPRDRAVHFVRVPLGG
eukprot:scaffold64613_cov60-Phaeocystis_antarctica.AAC.1